MKIYQIHEHSGQWEDYRDYIVGSYLLKEKAESEMERLVEKEIEREKCNDCPLYHCSINCTLVTKCESEECIKYKISETKKYCNRHDIYKDEYNDIECRNHSYGYTKYFKIEEVEVIE